MNRLNKRTTLRAFAAAACCFGGLLALAIFAWTGVAMALAEFLG